MHPEKGDEQSDLHHEIQRKVRPVDDEALPDPAQAEAILSIEPSTRSAPVPNNPSRRFRKENT